MTYGQLLARLNALSPAQLGCDVTIEDPYESEFFPAEFRISGEDNDVLGEKHPIIYLVSGEELGERM